MRQRVRGFGLPAVLVVALACSVSACASSSSAGNGDASTLLRQTFSGSHVVNSGRMSFTVTADPTGSSTATQPIVLSVGGPFQVDGRGKLPKYDFTISISALGGRAVLGVRSTGTSGYVTLQGTSYRLPAASYRQLGTVLSQLTSSSGTGSSGPAGLGIDPLRWLTNPSVVGTATVGGVQTTHIHAGVNVGALVSDLSTLLRKASSLAGSAGVVPSGIPGATKSQIASAIRKASVDVWTGSADKTVRQLDVDLTVAVAGQTSALLGGLRSAAIAIDLRYADLNQPQNITAPTSVEPYSAFQAKIGPLVQSIEGALAGSLIGGAASGAAIPPSASPAMATTPPRCRGARRC